KVRSSRQTTDTGSARSWKRRPSFSNEADADVAKSHLLWWAWTVFCPPISLAVEEWLFHPGLRQPLRSTLASPPCAVFPKGFQAFPSSEWELSLSQRCRRCPNLRRHSAP